MPRFLAWLIDLAAISFMYGAMSQFIIPGYGLLFNDLWSQSDEPIIYFMALLALGLVELTLILAMEVIFLRTLRATPGQRLVGLLTVTSESGLGLPWSRAVGRAVLTFGPWIAVLVVPFGLGTQLGVVYMEGQFAWMDALPWLVRVVAVVWFIGLALSTRSPDGRGFHDLASRSVVVRRVP